MNKIDLIIEALEFSLSYTPYYAKHKAAIAAARELKALKPVAWTGVSGVGKRIVCESKIYPFLNTPLYTLGESE